MIAGFCKRVVPMSEYKPPPHKPTRNDFFDDDPIIELTEEIPQKSAENSGAADPQWDDFSANRESSVEMEEDLIIQSAIAEYLADEDDPKIDMSDHAGFESHKEDDIVTTNTERDETFNGLAGIGANETTHPKAVKNQFVLVDEDEPDYKSDSDGFDFFAMEGDAQFDDDDVDLGDIRFVTESYKHGGDPPETPDEPPEHIELLSSDRPAFKKNARQLGSDVKGFPEPKAVTPIKSGDGLLFMDDEAAADSEPGEEIIEIAEFDQQYPENDDIDLEHAITLNIENLKDEDFFGLFEDVDPADEEKMELRERSRNNAPANDLSPLFDDVMRDEALFENRSQIIPDIPDGPEKDRPSDQGEFQPVTSRIDEAVERVIREKFADRIEQIIYGIIEAAVSKEIKRLKNALLEESSLEDDM